MMKLNELIKCLQEVEKRTSSDLEVDLLCENKELQMQFPMTDVAISKSKLILIAEYE